MQSDWSKISTDDLTTIHQAFERAIVDEDGSATIHLNSIHWQRCFGIKADIGYEINERAQRRSEDGEEEP